MPPFRMPFLAFLWTLASAAPIASADEPPDGADIAATCQRCHRLQPDGEDGWGPDLLGIVGRPVGAADGYRYGTFLREQNRAGATWTEASLRTWLVDSKAIARVAGARTKMPAQKLDDAELDALIPYLRSVTDAP